MNIVNSENFKKGCKFAIGRKWYLKDHIPMYVKFKCFKEGKSKDNEIECLRNNLNSWKACRGGKIDLKELHKNKEGILSKLPKINLGELNINDYKNVMEVIEELRKYKINQKTQKPVKSLVFSSKVAHFYFCGLIPVIDSTIREILKTLEVRGKDDEELYEKYLKLGNEELKNNQNNQQEVEKIYEYINKMPDCSVDRKGLNIDAKIYEWCLLGWCNKKQ